MAKIVNITNGTGTVELINGTYSLYKDGAVEGEGTNGFYYEGSYAKGTKLGYSSNNVGGMGGGPQGNMGGNPMGGGQTPSNMPGENNRNNSLSSSLNTEFVINGISK